MTDKDSPAGAVTRRSFVFLAAAATLTAHAQGAGDFPTRPIRLIVPYPPAGPSDRPARILAERLQVRLGQNIVVENRPGAAGILGTTQILQAPPDGYTLLLSTVATQITAPLIQEKPPYDGAKDFLPIGGIGRFNAVLLVNASVPAQNLRELVAYTKQHPGKLNYGSTGIGSITHLQTELVKQRTGLDVMHIPYKGGAAMVQGLVANEVQVLFGEVSTALPFIRSGRLRALALATEKRVPLLPEVPTLGEEGVRDVYTNGSWLGISARPDLPTAVAKRLTDALAEVAQDKEIKQYFADTGGDAVYSPPEAFKAMWAEDQKIWAKVIKTNRIRAE